MSSKSWYTRYGTKTRLRMMVKMMKSIGEPSSFTADSLIVLGRKFARQASYPRVLEPVSCKPQLEPTAGILCTT